MPGDSAPDPLHHHVELQRNYLHGGPRPGQGVCPTCFGAMRPAYTHCFACDKTAGWAGTFVADAVVPITYRTKDGQHADDLAKYKQSLAGTGEMRKRLFALF